MNSHVQLLSQLVGLLLNFGADQQPQMSTGSSCFRFSWSVCFLFPCAGKSTHLAQLMGDRGRVIALDRTHAKAQQIRYYML